MSIQVKLELMTAMQMVKILQPVFMLGFGGVVYAYIIGAVYVYAIVLYMIGITAVQFSTLFGSLEFQIEKLVIRTWIPFIRASVEYGDIQSVEKQKREALPALFTIHRRGGKIFRFHPTAEEAEEMIQSQLEAHGIMIRDTV